MKLKECREIYRLNSMYYLKRMHNIMDKSLNYANSPYVNSIYGKLREFIRGDIEKSFQ